MLFARAKTHIRRYEHADLAGLLSVWERASRIAHPFLSSSFLESERRNIPELYLPKAETWVAERRGAVVGFISMMGDEVGAIFVHPDHHGRGIGRALMDFARAGAEAIELEVFEANAIGRRFYKRYGFAEIARSVHEETGHRLIRMRCDA